ncbi:MAG: DUF885 domain-containing protein [Jiangellaceae bacterium]|nr:DUF885 domain-containing protein [Jiangellaceae bacterium]
MATMTTSTDLRTLADEYWEAKLQASPLTASFFGDHRYDDRADELSVEAEQRFRRTWSQLRDRAARLDGQGLDEADRVTRDLLMYELEDAITSIEHRFVELAPDQMQGAHAQLLMLASQLRAPEPQHAQMALTRIGELARMLDEATQRYVDGIRAGRTPAHINVTRSLHQVESYLASPLDTDPFVTLAGPPEWDGTPRWREQMTAAVRDLLRPAFGRYGDVFRTQLLSAARPDDRPGLCHLREGEDLYHVLIEHHTGLPLTAAELHQIGLDEVTGALRAEFAEIGARALGTSDIQQIFARLKNDPDLRYRDGDAVLQHARRCLEGATARMSDWFGILPQAACVLTPVPEFLAADVPGAYYTPPAPDGSRPGEYHVNLHEPTERARFPTASIAYHEAIPGHHLQLAIATERTDLPKFRRMSWAHTAFVEGWALYAERLADEMDLYDTPLDRLGLVASDAWRAGRLVVDTGLHAFGWTRQQAIDFLAEHMPVDLDTITVEVDRYIGMPAQALAYKVGQREIARMRSDARRGLGDRFDVKGFHDVVLGAATISLPVLGTRVAEWVASTQPA